MLIPNAANKNQRKPNWIVYRMQLEWRLSRKSYTLKVPVTLLLADLTADSRSKLMAELEGSCSCWDVAYEFQSASKEEEEEEAGFCWSSLGEVEDENQPSIFGKFCLIFTTFLGVLREGGGDSHAVEEWELKKERNGKYNVWAVDGCSRCRGGCGSV